MFCFQYCFDKRIVKFKIIFLWVSLNSFAVVFHGISPLSFLEAEHGQDKLIVMIISFIPRVIYGTFHENTLTIANWSYGLLLTIYVLSAVFSVVYFLLKF